MPICHDGYMGTAPDLSGSISKNRFRNELFWGIDRLLTCLDSGIDSFAVVFDYRCDIELHLVSPRPFRHHLYCESAPPPTRPNIAVRHRH